MNRTFYVNKHAGENNAMAPVSMPSIHGQQPDFGHIPGVTNYQAHSLFPGVNLVIYNQPASEPLKIDFKKKKGIFEFAFIQSGKTCASIHSRKFGSIELSDQSAITHYLPNMPGTFEVSGGCIQMLGIDVETHVLKNLLREEKRHCPSLARSLEKGSTDCFVQSGKMEAMQSMVVKQIFSNPFHGQAGSLFLQSKALELIAIQLHLLTHSKLPSRPDYFSADDEERIRHARHILKARMTSAPTLMELSAETGLSLSKLKKGFKIVFGKTAYACLHEDRMEKAYSLLSERRLNVSQVAWEIGYINVGHFSTAFRKQFGIRPKEFQLNFT